MHGLLFKDIHAVKLNLLAILTINALKLNNAMKAYLINPNVLYIVLNHYIFVNFF